MSIKVKTNNPSLLINDIKKLIDEKKIDTWKYDSDGDFTHSVPQWVYHAWIRSKIVGVDEVVFSILGRKDRKMTTIEYAVYHGRFVEMLLTHFDKVCKNIDVSSLPTVYDSLGKEPNHEA